MTHPVPVALANHVWVTPAEPTIPPDRPTRPARRADRAMFIHCVTDERDNLLYGVAALAHLGPATDLWDDDLLRPTDPAEVHVLREVLFHADDLALTHPELHADLVALDGTPATVSGGGGFRYDSPRPTLDVLSRTEFVTDWVIRMGAGVRPSELEVPLIVADHLPTTLSALAIGADEGTRGKHRGEWMLTLSTYRGFPRIAIRAGVSTFIRFTGWRVPGEGQGWNRGRFLDLGVACVAVTGEGPAGDGWNRHTTILAARQSLRTTVTTYAALAAEYGRHPADQPLEDIHSTAAIARSYFRAMGVTAPLSRSTIPGEVMGAFAQAYVGAWSECALPGVVTEAATWDVNSMYPQTFGLLGVWDVLTSATIVARDATADVRSWLPAVTAEDVLDPAFWPRLRGVAGVRTSSADLWSLRAQEVVSSGGGRAMTRLAHVEGTEERWVTLPDVVLSYLLTGRVPDVLMAVIIDGQGGRMAGLTPVSIRGAAKVDPANADYFAALVATKEAARTAGDDVTAAFVKLMVNTGCYGLFGQTTPRAAGPTLRVFDGAAGGYEVRPQAWEAAAEYTFLPFAALVTGGARLLLGLAEVLATREGGTIIYRDTDAVVLTDLADDGVALMARFDGLSCVPGLSFWKLESGDRFFSLATKRYARFHVADGAVVWDMASEHVFGSFLPPGVRVEEVWAVLAGLAPMPGDWADRPGRVAVPASRPSMLGGLAVQHHEDGTAWSERPKPFSRLWQARVWADEWWVTTTGWDGQTSLVDCHGGVREGRVRSFADLVGEAADLRDRLPTVGGVRPTVRVSGRTAIVRDMGGAGAESTYAERRRCQNSACGGDIPTHLQSTAQVCSARCGDAVWNAEKSRRRAVAAGRTPQGRRGRPRKSPRLAYDEEPSA